MPQVVFQLSAELREAAAAANEERAVAHTAIGVAAGGEIDEAEEDEGTAMTREILRLTSKFVCAFMHKNPTNQALAYASGFVPFVEMLPLKIGMAEVRATVPSRDPSSCCRAAFLPCFSKNVQPVMLHDAVSPWQSLTASESLALPPFPGSARDAHR